MSECCSKSNMANWIFKKDFYHTCYFAPGMIVLMYNSNTRLLFHDPVMQLQGGRQCVTPANLATGSSSSRWQELTGGDATGGFWQEEEGTTNTCTGKCADCVLFIQKCPVSNTGHKSCSGGEVAKNTAIHLPL